MGFLATAVRTRKQEKYQKKRPLRSPAAKLPAQRLLGPKSTIRPHHPLQAKAKPKAITKFALNR